MTEVVAAFTTPKLLSQVKSVAPEFASAAQPNTPLDQVRYWPAEQPPRLAPKRREVDAMFDANEVVVEFVNEELSPVTRPVLEIEKIVVVADAEELEILKRFGKVVPKSAAIWNLELV